MKLLPTIILIIFGIFSSIIAQEINVTSSSNSDSITLKIEVPMGVGSDVIKLDFTTEPKYIEIIDQSILTFTFVPIKKELILKGKKPGKTVVRIRNNVGDEKMIIEATVVSNSLSKTIQQLQEYLGDVEGLEIGVKADKIYIAGEIILPSDIGKINTVLTALNVTDFVSLVELAPQSKVLIAKKMQEELFNNGMKNVTSRIVNGRFWLEGTVESGDDRTKAEVIAAAYLPDNLDPIAKSSGGDRYAKKTMKPIENFITVTEKPQNPSIPKLIKVSAQFVQLTKEYAKYFGFRWNPMMNENDGYINFGKTSGGNFDSNASNGTLAGTIFHLFPKLASAKSAGHARIIQSGVVVVAENKQGTIEKKGTKQFILGEGDAQKAGVAESKFKIQVTPEIIKEDAIKLDNLSVEVKSMFGDPPEELVNSVNTVIVVKSNESAVIGGVVIKNNATDYDKGEPDTGSASAQTGTKSFPLFSFLRSKQQLSNRSQFVVFITPEIVESASIGTDDIKRKFKKRTR